MPVPVSASTYASQLGTNIREQLVAKPEADLRAILGRAIKNTADELDLTPGRSPSSTVTIARETSGCVEVLALGDSVAILPHDVVTDDRIDVLDLGPRRVYRERLSAGSGYDDRHRKVLRELQEQQAAHRNQQDGYWIAEANENAAQYALLQRYQIEEVPWLILASDGAYNTMNHLGLNDWSQVAHMCTKELDNLLQHCQTWEFKSDPDGKALPRAKRHDDKSLAAVLPGV